AWREHPRVPHPSGHFHFNVAPEIGRSMAGYRLGRTFIEEARRRGLPQWHAVVFAGPGRKSTDFFDRMGFEVFDRKPCSLLGPGWTLATIRKDLGDERTGFID
ncbi:MAG: hypothetical protein MH204_08425, partial [Fimbriimonadaceae bacterium]|nr:hypothetical protein [Fimbriimonadaceae bacterium]